MSLDSNYIPAYTLNTLFTDKTTAEALAGGVVTFYRDTQRATLKTVYQLTGTPANYSFIALDNPLILSSNGTFVDSNGDQVVVYLYPYDSQGDEDLYYITVYSADGVLQKTIEAAPYITSSGTSTTNLANANNEITNPQFSRVLFEGNGPITYSVSGAGNSVDFAPNWSLVTNGTGTVTLTRATSISTAAPSNPNYALTVTSSGVTSVKLRQRLNNTPRIFANGRVSSYFIAAVSSASAVDIELDFVPSNGTSYTLASKTFSGASTFDYAAANTAIDGIINPDSSTTGYVDIELDIGVNSTVTVSSIQIAGVSSDTDILDFDQQSVSRELDYMSHYYQPQLEYKPIPSYLVGWDFPFNPSQFHSSTWTSGQFNIGANKSQYIWDQTIAFQSVDQGISVARTSAGALQITAALDTQVALVQYLGSTEARELLLGRMAVNVCGLASTSTVFTVSLWYTTDASLPNITGGNRNSIVATLGSNGTVATQNGSWTEVARSSQGDAQGTLTTALTDYGFNQWTTGGTGSTNATFFAIVVGTAELTAGDTITFDSISLVKGDIPTRPAPKTLAETAQDCYYYYQKSFLVGTPPAQAAGSSGAYFIPQTVGASATGAGPLVNFPVKMRKTPSVILYNPLQANAEVFNTSTTTSWSGSTATVISANGFVVTGTTPGGSAVGQLAEVHWTADARYGIV